MARYHKEEDGYAEVYEINTNGTEGIERFSANGNEWEERIFPHQSADEADEWLVARGKELTDDNFKLDG